LTIAFATARVHGHESDGLFAGVGAAGCRRERRPSSVRIASDGLDSTVERFRFGLAKVIAEGRNPCFLETARRVRKGLQSRRGGR
jgi:hypothetical protein